MRAVITVIGHDTVGIIAKTSAVLSRHNVNILDITQSVLGDIFAMVMFADISGCNVPFRDLQNELDRQLEESMRRVKFHYRFMQIGEILEILLVILIAAAIVWIMV